VVSENRVPWQAVCVGAWLPLLPSLVAASNPLTTIPIHPRDQKKPPFCYTIDTNTSTTTSSRNLILYYRRQACTCITNRKTSHHHWCVFQPILLEWKPLKPLDCSRNPMQWHDFIFALHNSGKSQQQGMCFIWFLKRQKVVTVRGAVSSQRWPKAAPVLIAPTHGGMARLSGLDKYRDGKPANGRRDQCQY